MIYEDYCDTEPPRSIFEEEFGVDSKVLPPSRPNTEPTPMSYMISKVKLCLKLGNILQATTRVKNQVSYDEILRFDRELREVKAELPPHLRMRPLEESSGDQLTLIIARFNIDILYMKIMCLLHRKFASRARHNPRYAHSRLSAIEASMDTLAHLGTLQRESQPGGRLPAIKWYVTSIATKDFLLPAMLIMLDLHYDSQAEQSGKRQDSQSTYFWTPEQRMEMIRRLEMTRDVWKGLTENSMEAVKASAVLELMLQNIVKGQPQPQDVPAPAQQQDQMPNANPFANVESTQLQAPEHSAAMTLGMLSGGMSPNTAAVFNSVQSPGGTAYPAADLGFSLPPTTGTGLSPDYSADVLGMESAASPFAMFNNLGDNMDLTTTNFDWVSIFFVTDGLGSTCFLHCDPMGNGSQTYLYSNRTFTNADRLQDAFENYTQTAKWGPDQSFQFFSGNPE